MIMRALSRRCNFLILNILFSSQFQRFRRDGCHTSLTWWYIKVMTFGPLATHLPFRLPMCFSRFKVLTETRPGRQVFCWWRCIRTSRNTACSLYSRTLKVRTAAWHGRSHSAIARQRIARQRSCSCSCVISEYRTSPQNFDLFLLFIRQVIQV